jgi:hypothetical protein
MQHNALHSTAATAAVATVPAAAWSAVMVASAPGPILTASRSYSSIVTDATSTYWQPIRLLLLLECALHPSCFTSPSPTVIFPIITLPVTATIFATWLLWAWLLPCPTTAATLRPFKILQAVVLVSITTFNIILLLLLLLIISTIWLCSVVKAV